MTIPSPQNAYLVSSATGTIHPTVIFPRAPTSVDLNWPITQRWIDSADNNQEYFLLNFLSAGGVVTANWVILSGGSSVSGVQFLEGDVGGRVPPDVTSTINLSGDGSITTLGDPGTNTIAIELFGLVAHNVLVGVDSETIGNVPPSSDSGVPLISQGAASDPIFGTALVPGGGTGSVSFTPFGPVVAASTMTGPLTSVAPSATVGIPFVSQGAAAHPDFGTAVVAGGGTGDTSFVAFSPICGGTITTNPLQSVASVGTSGQVLTSNGPGMLPTFQSGAGGGGFTTVHMQVFNTAGMFTYTPTAGMKFCVVEVVGGGGGGGGCQITNATTISSSGGGGAGGYARSVLSAADVGASQPVAVGAGGNAGFGLVTPAGGGSPSSLGTLVVATGGGAGDAGHQMNSASFANGGGGGIGTAGQVLAQGGAGGYGIGINIGPTFLAGGAGGNSYFGGGARAPASVSATFVGLPGTPFGGGGSGCASPINTGAQIAGPGSSGIVVITEYI